MQDRYVGDVGDYCKLGLLRALAKPRPSLGVRLSLGINWYKTDPNSNKPIKQNDGGFIEYLNDQYRDYYKDYDKKLYKMLHGMLTLLLNPKTRKIGLIGKEIINAKFYNEDVLTKQDREEWHREALKKLRGTDVVFLDPDNGIETEKMRAKSLSKKHVRWREIEEYYKRGQSVIIYQHKYRITDIDFKKNILQLQRKFINADAIRIIKYSSYGIRYFILLLHEEHCPAIDAALEAIEKQGNVVTDNLKSIKKKKNVPKFCEVIYPKRKLLNSPSARQRRTSPQPK